MHAHFRSELKKKFKGMIELVNDQGMVKKKKKKKKKKTKKKKKRIKKHKQLNLWSIACSALEFIHLC
jgi:hypothetical protein